MRSRRQRTPRAATAAAALAAAAGLALLASACGGAGATPIAQVGTSTTTATTTTPSGSAGGGPTSGDPTAYSACMRSHGVPKFPDPGKNGDLRVEAGPGTGIDPSSAVFQAADRECRKLLPNGGQPDPQQEARMQRQALAFSQCMRAHGLAKFPDPVFSEGRMSMAIGKNSGIDPHSPQFQAAQKACQHLLGGKGPAGGPGGGQTQVNGKP